MLAIVSALYAVFGVVLVAAYFPQLLSVWRSRTGAADVSLGTWSIWSVSATVSLLYAAFVSRDTGYTLVSFGNLIGCYAITGLTAFKRYCGQRGESVRGS